MKIQKNSGNQIIGLGYTAYKAQGKPPLLDTDRVKKGLSDGDEDIPKDNKY